MQGTLEARNLRDIKPPLEIPQSLLIYFIGGAALLGFITLSAWIYARKRYRRVLSGPLAEDNSTPLPHEVAYEHLAAIEDSDWLERGDTVKYHTQIAYVLREYIRGRYQIPALELTTTALLYAMRRAQIGTSYVEHVQQLLASCDRVKFANYRPELSEATTRIADARWVVDNTKASIS